MMYSNNYLRSEPSILTLRDVQRILHIGKNSALRLVGEGILEAHRINSGCGKWLVFKEDLIEYLLEN